MYGYCILLDVFNVYVSDSYVYDSCIACNKRNVIKTCVFVFGIVLLQCNPFTDSLPLHLNDARFSFELISLPINEIVTSSGKVLIAWEALFSGPFSAIEDLSKSYRRGSICSRIHTQRTIPVHFS